MKRSLINTLKTSLFCLVMSASAFQAAAVSVTPQMMDQFKQLPLAEQRRLAQQYGIDPSMLGGAVTTSQPIAQPETPVVTPREVTPQPKAEVHGVAPVKGLKPFGYELFAGQPTTFAPVSDIPVPADYRIGPGDTINVQLYGKESKSFQLSVDRLGNIHVPGMEPITVIGMSYGELQQAIKSVVAEKMIGQTAHVSMGELRSVRIFVAGDAYNPGSYTVSSLSTVSQALFVAGGLKTIGSLRNIQVKRAGTLVATFDVYDLLMKGDASNDVRLQSGDVVFVPPVGETIAVTGEVLRPAIYELKGTETMAQVVAMAGGVKPGAYPAASIVERYGSNYLKEVLKVDLTGKQGQSLKAKGGDELVVRSTSNEYIGSITLIGQVNRPGQYQWYPGIRISDVLSSVKADLTWNSDTNMALVVRQTSINGDIEVKGFDLLQAITAKGGADDLALNANDKLIVFADRDEALDRRKLGKFFNKVKSDQTLQYLAEKNSQQLEDQELKQISDKKHMSSVAGVAVTESASVDKEKDLALANLMLLGLFNHPELINLSDQMSRRELLFPVMAKLQSQSRSQTRSAQVSVTGDVRYPDNYPLINGAKVMDLVALAGGLKESAYLLNAELSRTYYDNVQGMRIEHWNVDLTKAMDGDQDQNLNLVSKDRLNVLTKPAWAANETIEIRGEVKFPGTYIIQRGETLADVVERAGGFTEYAYLYGAVFTRESMKKQEALEIKRVTASLRKEIANRTLSQEGAFASVADTDAMLTQLEQIEPVGRLVIDLEGIMNPELDRNFNVEAGDLLYIPPMRQVVAVMGEVQHATSHRFDTALSLKDYMRMSGNTTQRADDERTYVVRADGSVMLPENSYWFGGKQSLKPGDTVIVPLDTNYKDNLTLWSQVTNIIYNSAVALSALNIL
ncbi:SLBB domain-containing protein [Ferrimonas sp. SCSIO 43195]|uniref:SLBB domain-containing protein n=1 Tax=Ferrimonas sp. SCSIO 43195 TaxID=2822844 RepID=UPI0020754FB1|nr:SLBB domain-containing protein [Ferrimonas sp. SCSIO 43195]USD38660.1 SLBB domain-containing protein [Ferrimonas sp. SCSIO 43195]